MTRRPPAGAIPHPPNRLRKGTLSVPDCGSRQSGPEGQCRIPGVGLPVLRMAQAIAEAAADRVRGPESGHLHSSGPVRGCCSRRRAGIGLPQFPAWQVRRQLHRRRARRLTPTRIGAAQATGPVRLELHAAAAVRPGSCRPVPQGSPRFPGFGFRCRSGARTPHLRRSRS